MNFPRITVITPTYNCATTLRDCIESVIGQNYPNLEYWLIDSISTDGSLEIIREYAQKYPFIHFISEKDNGIYDAMNKGTKMATGEWIYFLGGDDILCDNILNDLTEEFSQNSVDFLYGNVIFSISGIKHNGSFDIAKLMDHNICHQAIFVKKAVLTRMGGFETKYKILADWYFTLRCFADKNLKIKYIDKVIAYFYEIGISGQVRDTLFYQDKELILLKYFSNTKAVYEQIGVDIFSIFRSISLLKAWKYIFLASLHTRKYLYYLRNGFYWTRQVIAKR